MGQVLGKIEIERVVHECAELSNIRVQINRLRATDENHEFGGERAGYRVRIMFHSENAPEEGEELRCFDHPGPKFMLSEVVRAEFRELFDGSLS